MKIWQKKLIHDRRLFVLEGVSREMGRRVLRELEQRGVVAPERSPSGRRYLSAEEAERFHEALVTASSSGAEKTLATC